MTDSWKSQELDVPAGVLVPVQAMSARPLKGVLSEAAECWTVRCTCQPHLGNTILIFRGQKIETSEVRRCMLQASNELRNARGALGVLAPQLLYQLLVDSDAAAASIANCSSSPEDVARPARGAI
ncbi:unnamed protein product [Symbiodinium natans]|uniref:Uncharacterized protein n=1 Tax=Symbiodinium natans TaxID=878477 RepID=A0A812Q049_9DINO|nr:unnamed protein product [Symbiodinium natans]